MKYTYDAFSHYRASVDVPYAYEPFLAARYAPYTPEKTKVIAVASEMEVPESEWPPRAGDGGRGGEREEGKVNGSAL